MGTVIVRGERYEVNINPLHWPAAEAMIVEQNTGVAVDQLQGLTMMFAVAFIGVRTMRPRLSWADHIKGLTGADIDYEPDPGEVDEAEAEEAEGRPPADSPAGESDQASPGDEIATSSV